MAGYAAVHEGNVEIISAHSLVDGVEGEYLVLRSRQLKEGVSKKSRQSQDLKQSWK